MPGELNNSQVENVLHSEMIGSHANGIMYTVPVSHAYDGEYVYAHTKEGMKIEIMRKNPQVCFEADVMENMSNWRSVIAWDRFEEMKKPKEREISMEKLIVRIMPPMTGETTLHHARLERIKKMWAKYRALFSELNRVKEKGRFEKR